MCVEGRELGRGDYKPGVGDEVGAGNCGQGTRLGQGTANLGQGTGTGNCKQGLGPEQAPVDPLNGSLSSSLRPGPE